MWQGCMQSVVTHALENCLRTFWTCVWKGLCKKKKNFFVEFFCGVKCKQWNYNGWILTQLANRKKKNHCWSLSSERHRITLCRIQPDSSTAYLSCCGWRTAVTQTLSVGGGERCKMTRKLHADRCQSLRASEGPLLAAMWHPGSRNVSTKF